MDRWHKQIPGAAGQNQIHFVKHTDLPSMTNSVDTRKTNMEPENEPLEEEIPIRNHHFQVPC